jgi:hypothetical protein
MLPVTYHYRTGCHNPEQLKYLPSWTPQISNEVDSIFETLERFLCCHYVNLKCIYTQGLVKTSGMALCVAEDESGHGKRIRLFLTSPILGWLSTPYTSGTEISEVNRQTPTPVCLSLQKLYGHVRLALKVWHYNKFNTQNINYLSLCICMYTC